MKSKVVVGERRDVAVAKQGSNTEEIVREIFVAEDEREERDVGAGKGDESQCNGHDELTIGDLELRSSYCGGKFVVECSMWASDSRMRMCVAPLSGMNETAVSRL